MPPKRQSSGLANKSQQSTLAFHGASNKVIKAGARTQSIKKNLAIDASTKAPTKPDIVDIAEKPGVSGEIDEQSKEEAEVRQAETVPEDDEARQISEAAIRKYWETKEKQRMAPRVHQQDVSLHEKILREFDMSSHFGPSTGITRIKRWKRAHQLGLDPPTEVLAVLLQDMSATGGATTMQRSRVDELLSSKIESDAS